MKHQLLIMLGAAAIASAPAFAQDIEYEGVNYSVIDGTEVQAKGFAGDSKDNLAIPATFTVDGTEYTVVAIGDDAFRGAGIRSLELPETLRSIGNSSFAFNVFMKQCNLPESLKSVGDNAFQRCFSATFSPKGIEHIGAGAFWECSKIAEVVIPANAEIGDNAFMYCTGVKTLVLEGVPASIGICSLSFNSLQEFTVKCATPPDFVPEDVFTYGDNETRDYKWTLRLADVALKVPTGAADTYKTDRNWSVFTDISEYEPDVITDFTVAPLTYKVLADNNVSAKAFDGSVKEFDIPSTVDFAGQTFNIVEIADNSFANSAIEKISIPGSIKTIGANAFANTSLSSLSLTEGLETIQEHAFEATALTEVVIPDGVKEIGYGAFIGCRSLSSLTLPAGINVNELAFLNCALKQITLNGAPGEIKSQSMPSPDLRQIIFHTDVVPELSPADVWLMSGNEFNDQVVLLADTENDMAQKFRNNPAWNVFKAIYPIGTKYNEDAPYLPQNVISYVAEVNASTGLKAFVPAKNSIRVLTPYRLSFIVWDGSHGMRIDSFSNRLSGGWWDSFKPGDILDGYIIGMMNQEKGIFTSTSYSVENTACDTPMTPVTVTGSQLTDKEDNSCRYAYVSLEGRLNRELFISADSKQFTLKNINGENLETNAVCENAKVKGIYTYEETEYGLQDCLIIIDENDFYTAGIGMPAVQNVDDVTIYSISGVACGNDASVLAPGMYIRGNKKVIIY